MIAKGNKNVIDIFYGDKSIYEIYKGDTLVFSKRAADDTGIPTKITQLTFEDSKKDPMQMATGVLGKDGNPKKHVVSWVRTNSHRYVGTYNTELGMVLKQLDDNDSTKYADGTDASIDITTKDVFMKMPDFWFRGEEVSAYKYNIYFSAVEPADNESWIKWDGNTLIGVYEASCQDTSNNTGGEVYSRSGVTPTVNVSHNNFKDKSRNRSNNNDHSMLVTYEAHQIMALLYIAYYGDNMNAQAVIGSGTSSYPNVTGDTNIDGMNDTKAENSRSINFWGLENWWGDIEEFIDNLINQDSNGLVNILDYEGNIKRQVSIGNPRSTFGVTTKMLKGNKMDMLPTEVVTDNTYSTYYCDRSSVSRIYDYKYSRSFYSNLAIGGPFYIATASAKDKYLGSRLQYNGRVVIADADTALINSVDLVPVILNTKKEVSVPSATVVIKGNNLDKLDDNITGLPEGATVSWLSEGTTERVATFTGVNADKSLKFNFGGYEVSIVNPDSLPADLQRVFYNEKKALRTGMDFHICDVEDFSEVSNIKLQGLNINYPDIKFVAVESVEVSFNSVGNLTVKGDNSYESIEIGLNYKDNIIGTLKIHKSSEEDVLKALEEELSNAY